MAKCQYQAGVIEATFAAGVLATVSSGSRLGADVSPGAYKLYHDKILAESGPARDPIERMLTEQLLWCHHRIGNLHAAAATAKEPDLVSALNAAAVKLMAEFRRSALALREYKSPATPRQITLVKQQNLAANQQVALVETESADQMPVKNAGDIELGSNQALLTHDEPIPFIPKAACREAEPAQTPRSDTRRSAALERSSPPDPAVAVLDRS